MKPHPPSSTAFWILSSAYCEAGDSTLAMIRKDDYRGMAFAPCIFLYFRSVELALKAVLVYHGVLEREISKVLGHDIARLISRAGGFAPLAEVGIRDEDRTILERFSDDYANKWFEYSGKWFRRGPRLEELRDFAHKVSKTVREYVRKRPNRTIQRTAGRSAF